MKNRQIAVQVATTFAFASPRIKGQILRSLQRQAGPRAQACLAAVAYVMFG